MSNKNWNNNISKGSRYPFCHEPFTEDMEVEMEFAEYLDFKDEVFPTFEEGPLCEYEAFMDMTSIIESKEKIQMEAEQLQNEKRIEEEQKLIRSQQESEERLRRERQYIEQQAIKVEAELEKKKQLMLIQRKDAEEKEKQDKQQQEADVAKLVDKEKDNDKTGWPRKLFEAEEIINRMINKTSQIFKDKMEAQEKLINDLKDKISK